MTDQSEKIAELEQRIVDLNEQEAELCMLYGIVRQGSFSLSARIKDLEAQIEALQADADRHRWWVGILTTNSDSALGRVDDAFKHLSKETVITVKQFNEAIDAAIKQGSKA